MKSIYVVFEDSDFSKLESMKGDKGWRDAILQWAKVK
jgi:hypothetical protein